jgi:hypothetical protein
MTFVSFLSDDLLKTLQPGLHLLITVLQSINVFLLCVFYCIVVVNLDLSFTFPSLALSATQQLQ